MNTTLISRAADETPSVEIDSGGGRARLHELALLLMGGLPTDRKVKRFAAALFQLGSFVSDQERHSSVQAHRLER